MKNGNARVTTAVRYFAESRAPTEITEGDLLDKDLLKIERFRKWNQKSSKSTTSNYFWIASLYNARRCS